MLAISVVCSCPGCRVVVVNSSRPPALLFGRVGVGVQEGRKRKVGAHLIDEHQTCRPWHLSSAKASTSPAKQLSATHLNRLHPCSFFSRPLKRLINHPTYGVDWLTSSTPAIMPP